MLSPLRVFWPNVIPAPSQPSLERGKGEGEKQERGRSRTGGKSKARGPILYIQTPDQPPLAAAYYYYW